MLLWVRSAPNVNPCGGTSKGGGRAKMEVAPRLLKAGMGTGSGSGSFGFEKPKLKDGAPTRLLLSHDPKSFCSYSCSCWYASTKS